MAVVTAILALPGVLSATPFFIRGDADQDGRWTVLDAITIVRYEFLATIETHCADALDADDSGKIDVVDALRVLQQVLGRAPRRLRFSRFCAPDSTHDSLDCETYAPCEGELPTPLPRDPDAAVVFLVEASVPMESSGELAIAGREAQRWACLFVDTVKLAVYFFHETTTRFPPSGVPAALTPENRRDLAKFPGAVPGPGACFANALVEGIDALCQTDAATRVLVYVGSARDTCTVGTPEQRAAALLERIRTKNTCGVVIHTLCALTTDRVREKLVADLAEENDGQSICIRR